MSADFVVVTGDLANTGSVNEYERLRDHLRALLSPYCLLPGNHDNRDALRRVFHDDAYLFENRKHISYTVDLGDVRIIALDSTEPGRAGGFLDADRLRWLRSQLRIDSQRPVLLALHHPPFRTGVWPMDWLGFVNVRELAKIVEANGQIRRVVSGHVHSARSACWAGTFACSCPSTKTQTLVIREQFALPRFRVAPAGFLIHSFSAGADVRTCVHQLNGSTHELGAS